MAMRPENMKKECPDCGWMMELESDDFTFWCPNPNCEYTEFCEDGKPARPVGVELEEEDMEDEEEYRCPHCHHVIDEGELPER